MKLVIDEDRTSPSVPDHRLTALVAQARSWFAELESCAVRSVHDLASRHRIDRGDVSRILPLAFLAPDIVQAILDGHQPVDLTTARLKRLRDLPASWTRQRRLLGFS
jgi:hypothetical protein